MLNHNEVPSKREVSELLVNSAIEELRLCDSLERAHAESQPARLSEDEWTICDQLNANHLGVWQRFVDGDDYRFDEALQNKAQF